MERLILLVALGAVAYGFIRDIVDLFGARERGQPQSEPEPEFRNFNPNGASPRLDIIKLGLAYFVDLIPFAILLLILHVAFVPLSSLNPAGIEAGSDGFGTLVEAMVALIEVIAAFALTRLMHIALVAKTQRSPGWFLTGYRVVNDDGTAPAFWSYLGRSFDELRSSTGRSTSRIRYVARECKLVNDAPAPSSRIAG